MVHTIEGGITAPAGFTAAGIHAGIKKTDALDLALIVSDCPGAVAGVFTRNRVVAAPVILDKRHLRRGIGQAILINSGNANACTGARGMAAAQASTELVAAALGIPVHHVFIGSTGVIGQTLPLSRIEHALKPLIGLLSRKGGHAAATAIMTTDLRPKEIALQTLIGGKTVRLGGMAKGSGMIHPNMATMLAYLTTDAAVERRPLQQALVRAVDESFNAISVDGDTSTNDTVMLLSNGRAGNRPLNERTPGWSSFQNMLNRACRELALQVVRDGEGVTKILEIDVRGARSPREAKMAANAIATSCLVKTAMFGEDANWGRILAALGRSGAHIDQSMVDLDLGRVPIVRRGVSLGDAAERRIARAVKRKDILISADLHLGTAQARVWTTDLSYDYVRINASYRT